MEELLQKFATQCKGITGYTIKTASRTPIARDFLREADEKSATVLMMALRNLHSIDALYWEPETIWLTLLNKDEIDLSVVGRDKLQAALSIMRNPAFFWDNLVFQRTVQSLNGELYDPETLQECHPGCMAWAIYEASLLRGMDPEDPEVLPELDEDVQQYAAVCLQRAGYVYPPSQLRAVADNLKALFPTESHPFIATVKKSWERLPREALQDRKFPEDPLGVQLAQLASCYLYVKENAERLAEDVLTLDSD